MELWPQRLAVQAVRALDRRGLVDGAQAHGFFRRLHLERGLPALERRNIHEGPPVRLAVGQLDLEPTDRLAVDRHAHQSFRPVVLHRKVKVRLLNGDRACLAHDCSLRLMICLDDLVHVDMAPAAAFPIDNLNDGLLVPVLPDVPAMQVECLAPARRGVRPGGGRGHLAVNQQVHARPALIPAAANQECDVLPLDGERGRGERAGWPVAAKEGVDQALALEAGHHHLARQGSIGRGCAERGAFRLPAAIVGRLEIVDQNVARGSHVRHRRGSHGATDSRRRGSMRAREPHGKHTHRSGDPRGSFHNRFLTTPGWQKFPLSSPVSNPITTDCIQFFLHCSICMRPCQRPIEPFINVF